MPELITLSEFLEREYPPEQWIVQDTLPEIGVSLIAASPKTGKSTFVRQLALAVAAGAKFFGKETAEARVLYVVLDEDERDVHEHLTSIAPHFKGVEDQLTLLLMRGEDYAPAWVELKKAMEDTGPYGLVIVDTMIDLVDPTLSLNDYQVMREALKVFVQVAHEYECHVSLIHHTRKASGLMDAGDMANILGSQALRSITNVNISMWREGDQRFIASEARRGTEIVKTEVLMDEKTRLIKLGHTEEYKLEVAVLATLDREGALTKAGLVEEVGWPKAQVMAMVKSLMDRGFIVKCGREYMRET